MKKHSSGFTLLEMSVVLVIIALLIGGVFMGRTLIENAEQQTVIREYSLYQKAIGEFQDKYNQLPGDMTNATTLWGADPLGCNIADVRATPLNTTQTCNGDGNGTVGDSTGAGAASQVYEYWWAWSHLANAGLVDGRYIGTRYAAANGGRAVPGVNVPASKVEGAGWTLYYLQVTSDNARYFAEANGGYGHMLSFGADTEDNTVAYAPVITATAALSIDSRIDDGKPGLGTVRALRSGTNPDCTENDTSQSAATYAMDDDKIACSLTFILGF